MPAVTRGAQPRAQFLRYNLFAVDRAVIDHPATVFAGEVVPASDKLVTACFELACRHFFTPARAITTSSTGHKLNVATGKSGMILDVVVEDGNPADSARFLPMLERHVGFYEEAPRQSAADGGFASRENLIQAKALGVSDVAFHKKCGLTIEDMVKSPWVYRQLRNFSAGIEAGISCLKRAYGLTRCTWRGIDHFKSYVWLSVVANNLALFARLKPT